MVMIRRRRIAVLATLGTIALLAAARPRWGSYLGRHLSWLTVERVEISGTRLLAPHEVLAASGIQPGQHLLDDRENWEAALEAHPVIAAATV
ncbi:MAG: FtsQ-type POTRA domain-containing protein, partial [Gemmatimonadota bacterium]